MGAVVLLPSCQRHFNGTHQGFSPRVSVWRFICFYFNVVLTLTSGQILWFKWSLQFFFKFFFFTWTVSPRAALCVSSSGSPAVFFLRMSGVVDLYYRHIISIYLLYCYQVVSLNNILIRYKHGDKNTLLTWKTPWIQGISNIATKVGHIKLIDI